MDIGRVMQDTVFPGGYEVRITVNRKKTETSITFKRKKNNYWESEPNMLLTIPEISFCSLSPSVKFTAPSGTSVEIPDGKNSFNADKVKLKKNEVHFYYRKNLVMAIAREGWYIKAENEKGSGKMHQFVGICFDGNERVYDYLCDGIDVKPGDHVIVPSYNGPVRVKVVRVYEQSEADAPLEITRYKKVEKAE